MEVVTALWLVASIMLATLVSPAVGLGTMAGAAGALALGLSPVATLCGGAAGAGILGAISAQCRPEGRWAGALVIATAISWGAMSAGIAGILANSGPNVP